MIGCSVEWENSQFYSHMKPTITAVIITKNEEKMIANCLETLRWCTDILVIDNGSDDNTVELAEKLGAKVVKSKTTSFAEQRNLALKSSKSDWLFYIDADERVTPKLSQEILVQIETTTHNALTLHRQNMMYGKYFAHGGWGNEKMTRIFRKTGFQEWVGDIHETPKYEGSAIQLHLPLLHFTHRNTMDGLKKTIAWTPMEAKLLYEAGAKPVSLWTLLRKGTMEFLRRAVLRQGFKDGEEGVMEAVVQGINRVLVYIQVWELQQRPSLSEKYEEAERGLLEDWKKKAS